MQMSFIYFFGWWLLFFFFFLKKDVITDGYQSNLPDHNKSLSREDRKVFSTWLMLMNELSHRDQARERESANAAQLYVLLTLHASRSYMELSSRISSLE